MLYQRGAVWWMSFTTPSGKRVRCSTRTTDRKAAQEKHDQAKNDCWRVDELKETPKRSWDEVALLYLKAFDNRDKSRHVLFFTQHFRGVALQDISQAMVEKSLEGLQKPFNFNRHLSTIRHLFNWSVEKRYLNRREWLVKGLKEPKKRIEWLTHEEAQALIASLPERHRAFVRFAFFTGLRLGNVLGLEWSQVDLKRGCAWIHADQAKGDEPIAVPLNSDAREIIRGQLGKDLVRVFPQNRVDTRVWKKALKKAGITRRIRFHDTRHTWASWHVQAGTPLLTLKEMGGWATLAMVLKYAHLSSEHLTNDAERISSHSWHTPSDAKDSDVA